METTPEYQRQVEEYNQSLRTSIGHSRQQILRHIKHTFSEVKGQPSIRMLSWEFSSLCTSKQSFHEGALKLLEGRGVQPLFKIATSRQDAYHHSHFINAFLLSLLKPNAHLTQLPIEPIIFCIIGSNDETERLEEMDKLYLHLSSKIPDSHKINKQVTLEMIYEKLQAIETVLNATVTKGPMEKKKKAGRAG